MKKFFCFFLLFSTFCLLSVDNLLAMNKTPMSPQAVSGDCCLKGYNSRIIVKHREHNGVGYDTGYTTFAAFLSPYWSKMYRWQPFFDGRAHVFNDGRFAANAGIGIRVPVENEYWPFASISNNNWVFGTNLYYDFRKAKQGLNIHQIGAGLEALSRHVDLRLNGYYPFSGTKTITTFIFDRFVGNNAVLRRKARISLPSIQGEVGFPIPGTEIVDLYFAIGPYYLFNQHTGGQFGISSGNTWGGKARLTAQVYEGISLGIEGTYDGIFYGTFQGYVAFSLPLGPANIRTGGYLWKKWYNSRECCAQAYMTRRLTQDVQRNEIIPVRRRERNDIPFINPNTGLPFHFIFVDNTSSSLGTFESPFSTLAAAQAASKPGDIIYLYPGNGTTTGYDAGFAMQTGQMLSGTGTELRVGGVSIPPLTPGRMPMMTNTAGDGVNLADFTTVQGLFVNDPTGVGINATGTINGSVISANRILTTGTVGVQLLGPMGDHLIESNTINTDSIGMNLSTPENFRGKVRRNNVFISGGASAIQFINTGTAQDTLIVADNFLSTIGSSFVKFDIQTTNTTILDVHRNTSLGAMTFIKPSTGDICLSLDGNTAASYTFTNTAGATFKIRSPSQMALESGNVAGPGGFTYTPDVGSFLFDTGPCP